MAFARYRKGNKREEIRKSLYMAKGVPQEVINELSKKGEGHVITKKGNKWLVVPREEAISYNKNKRGKVMKRGQQPLKIPRAKAAENLLKIIKTENPTVTEIRKYARRSDIYFTDKEGMKDIIFELEQIIKKAEKKR